MKKNISVLTVIVMLISILALLSACKVNTIPNSIVNNSNSINELGNNMAGIWLLLEDDNPYASVYFLSISKEMKMTGGVYPGYYDRTCEIIDIHAQNDGSFQAVLYYPETEATELDDGMPEHRESVILSSNDSFRASLIIEYNDGRKEEFKYVSSDFDNATKEFDRIIALKSSHSSSQNQGQSSSQTPVYTYTHSALEGAVIVESDPHTGEIRYKYKCEKCGFVDSSTVQAYIRNGGRESSFYCSNCEFHQKVIIHCETHVDWK